MSTDQQFIEKENKHLTGFEKFIKIFVPIAAIGIGIIVTLTLFVFKPDQPCDPIDPEGAWCQVHPLYWWDILGLILFYWGDLWLSSITPRILIAMNKLSDDSDKFPMLNAVGFLAALVGFLLMYLV